MKIFTSALVTETNTFSTFPTTLASFEELGVIRGPVPPQALGDVGPIVAQWRRAAGRHGDEVHEGVYAVAQPAGRVEAQAYAQLRGEILAAAKAAMPLDMVLLFLHGAMVAEGEDDCEGDLIHSLRDLVGPRCVIGVELDPHCHMSEAMTRYADAIILMREYPHTDYEERAVELFDVCRDAATGATRPVMAVADCRMVGFYPTTSQPMRGLVDRLREVEARPGVLSASLVHGFPWGDVGDAGTKVLVVADGDEALATAVASELAQAFYRVRRTMLPKLETVDEALEGFDPRSGEPRILADAGDNPGGGAPGDHAVLLAALVQRTDLRSVVGMVCDSQAVEACFGAGIGVPLRLCVGGKAGAASGRSLEINVTVRGLAQEHSQSVGSIVDPLGRAAWVRCGTTDIVLCSRRQQTLSPTAFTGLGVPLHEAQVISVKSSHHYYAEFSKLSTDCHVIETGAALSMDFARLPYQHRDNRFFPAVDNPAPHLA